MSKPYLSIVIAGRNDHYGGDFKERLQHCFSLTYSQLTTYEIYSEIIFVNYNPLSEPNIEQFINWQVSNKFVTVKIITVPAEVHLALIESGERKNVPMLEYCAKNVGIRISAGEYILCLNPDILLPDEFFKNVYLLNKHTYYCADRIDFRNFDSNNKPQEIFRISMKGHAYDYSISNPLSFWFLKLKNYLLCKWKYHSKKHRFFFERRNWNIYFHNIEYRYHCNVSGDFMLMHKSIWEQLKGYSEQTYISLHVDALMVIQAASLGLKEKVISSPIYHKEHSRRYDSTHENPEYRNAYLFFEREAQKMLAEKKPTIYNDENWGLNNFILKEQVI